MCPLVTFLSEEKHYAPNITAFQRQLLKRQIFVFDYIIINKEYNYNYEWQQKVNWINSFFFI